MLLCEKLVDEVRSVSPLRRAALAPSTFEEYRLRTREFISFLEVCNRTNSSFVELYKALCELGP